MMHPFTFDESMLNDRLAVLGLRPGINDDGRFVLRVDDADKFAPYLVRAMRGDVSAPQSNAGG